MHRCTLLIGKQNLTEFKVCMDKNKIKMFKDFNNKLKDKFKMRWFEYRKCWSSSKGIIYIVIENTGCPLQEATFVNFKGGSIPGRFNGHAGLRNSISLKNIHEPYSL